jgi:predicted DNA-binding protein (MmcQ/YjbR family)
VPEDEFDAITSIDGIRPAPYAARFHWVSIDDPKALPEDEALGLIRGSYDLVKAKLSKKLKAQIDASPGPGRPAKRGAHKKH